MKNIFKTVSYYRGIIIVRGGAMFVDFVGYSYSQMYVPTNVTLQIGYPRNYIETNQQNFDKPRPLAPTKNNYSKI